MNIEDLPISGKKASKSDREIVKQLFGSEELEEEQEENTTNKDDSPVPELKCKNASFVSKLVKNSVKSLSIIAIIYILFFFPPIDTILFRVFPFVSLQLVKMFFIFLLINFIMIL